MIIRHEINILNRSITGVTGDQAELVYFDPAQFNGSFTYYFESDAANSDGVPQSISLHGSDHVAHSVDSIPPGGPIARSRDLTVTALTADTYHISIASADITVQAARIVILQDTGVDDLLKSECQFEIGDYEAMNTEAPGAPLAYPKYWLYTAANWDGTVTMYAEVCLLGAGSMDGIEVKVQEDTGGDLTNWSDLETIVADYEAEVVGRERVEINPLPTSGNNLRIFATIEDDMDDPFIYSAKIIVVQIPLEEYLSQKEGALLTSLYGGSGTFEELGQAFTTIGSAISPSVIALKLQEFGSVSDNCYIEIASAIDGATIANGTSNTMSVAGKSSGTWVAFFFPTPPSLSATTQYFIRLLRDGSRDTNNYPRWTLSSSDVYGSNSRYIKNNGSWDEDTGEDFCFIIFSGKITKQEEQYLLLNSEVNAGTGLQDFDTLWDPAEWDGVDLVCHHEISVDNAAGNPAAKLQYDSDDTPEDVVDSDVAATDLRERSAAMTMPAADDIDVNITDFGA